MREALILVYATAVGFAASGVLSTFIQMVTRRPVAFAVPAGGAPAYVITALGFMVIGPYVVARSTLRLAFAEGRSIGILGGGLAIATGWAMCSGVALLGFVLAIG